MEEAQQGPPQLELQQPPPMLDPGIGFRASVFGWRVQDFGFKVQGWGWGGGGVGFRGLGFRAKPATLQAKAFIQN